MTKGHQFVCSKQRIREAETLLFGEVLGGGGWWAGLGKGGHEIAFYN